jgi:hypothetical protein
LTGSVWLVFREIILGMYQIWDRSWDGRGNAGKPFVVVVKQIRLVERFVAGTTARTAAELIGVNPKTAAFYFQRLRQRMEQANSDVTRQEVPAGVQSTINSIHSELRRS